MAILGENKPIDIVPGADLYFPVYRYAGVQRVTLLGSPTGGTFTLTYRGGTATGIAYNVDGAALQAALEAVPTFGPGNVVVTGAAGGPWDVAVQRQIDTLEFLRFPLTATAALTGGTNPHVQIDRPLDDCTGRTYELQARTVAGSATPKIRVTDAGTADGEIDMTDAASGILVVHVEDTATAALDFNDNVSNKGSATWVLMEITDSGARKDALVDSGIFRLKGAYFV